MDIPTINKKFYYNSLFFNFFEIHFATTQKNTSRIKYSLCEQSLDHNYSTETNETLYMRTHEG